MKLLGLKLFERKSIENPSVSIPDAINYLYSVMNQISASGEPVNKNTALTLPAFYAGVRVISETIASIGLHLYRKTDFGSEIVSGALDYMISSEPNKLHTSFVFREAMMANTLTAGNGYAHVRYNRSGEVRDILPLPSDQIDPYLSEGRIWYLNRNTGVVYHSDDIIHIPGLSYDGIKGESILKVAANSIGLGLAYQRFGSSLFKNGAKMSGILKHPGTLSDPAAKRLKDNFDKAAEKPHSTVLLEEGMEYIRVSISPAEAQLIEQKRFSVEDVARILRLPPHMLADLSRSTNNNIEHQSLEFVQYAILPWVKKWEQELNKKLLTRDQKNEGYFFRFNVDSLLRGDIKTRSEHYVRMIQNGVISPNEVRELENMNKREGGDIYLTPLNMNNGQAASE